MGREREKQRGERCLCSPPHPPALLAEVLSVGDHRPSFSSGPWTVSGTGRRANTGTSSVKIWCGNQDKVVGQWDSRVWEWGGWDPRRITQVLRGSWEVSLARARDRSWMALNSRLRDRY